MIAYFLRFCSLAVMASSLPSSSSSSCTATTAAGAFDFSPLGTVRVLSYEAASLGWTYLFSACENVGDGASALCGGSRDTPALQATSGACHSLGRLSRRSVAPLPLALGVGATVTFEGGDLCGNVERTISIDVVCADVAHATRAEVLESATRGCAYNARVESRAGCPLACARDPITGTVCGGAQRGKCAAAEPGGAAVCVCASGYSGQSCSDAAGGGAPAASPAAEAGAPLALLACAVLAAFAATRTASLARGCVPVATPRAAGVLFFSAAVAAALFISQDASLLRGSAAVAELDAGSLMPLHDDSGASSLLVCKRCLRHGPKMALRRCLPAACAAWPATGRKVVSLSLFGENAKYTIGALRNAELAPTTFPGWELVFFTNADASPALLAELQALGAQVQIVSSKDAGFGYNWRFLVADNSTVDMFVCRDGDSRLLLRDFYAVSQWAESDKPFHVMRDHPAHGGCVIPAGMWGARNKVFAKVGTMESLLLQHLERKKSGELFGDDQNFLAAFVWPEMLRHGVMQHDSYSCAPGRHGDAGGQPFPRQRVGTEFVGFGYWFPPGTEMELPHQSNLQDIINNPGAPACLPPPTRPGNGRTELTLSSALAVAPSVPWREFFQRAADGSKLLSTAWRQAAGAAQCKRAPPCGSAQRRSQPVVLQWRDAFVDHSRAAQDAVFTAVFDYDHHLVVGAPEGTAVPQFHERVDKLLEPLQALDGGVRFYSSILVPTVAYGDTGSRLDYTDIPGIAAFVIEDLPRMLRAVPPETLVLLPGSLLEAVERSLAAQAAAFVLTREAADKIAMHLIEHEGSPALYYARNVYVHGCGC